VPGHMCDMHRIIHTAFQRLIHARVYYLVPPGAQILVHRHERRGQTPSPSGAQVGAVSVSTALPDWTSERRLVTTRAPGQRLLTREHSKPMLRSYEACQCRSENPYHTVRALVPSIALYTGGDNAAVLDALVR
jgi:hypothetical protein